jgi:hypothetical protein
MVGGIELTRVPVAYAMWIEAPSFEALRDDRHDHPSPASPAIG